MIDGTRIGLYENIFLHPMQGLVQKAYPMAHHSISIGTKVQRHEPGSIGTV